MAPVLQMDEFHRRVFAPARLPDAVPGHPSPAGRGVLPRRAGAGRPGRRPPVSRAATRPGQRVVLTAWSEGRGRAPPVTFAHATPGKGPQTFVCATAARPG